VLGGLDVVAWEAPADATYGLLRARLDQAGRPIRGNDLLIAAQAVTLGYTIVTGNEKEFAHIEGLLRENWARKE
jgi:tRNA(fMet)-specific endonuclease VapC